MELKDKCIELFEKSNPVTITAGDQAKLSELFGEAISDEYKFILSNYGGIYVRENMRFHSMETTPLASSDGLESFLFFFGIDGRDNLFQIRDMYAAQIPADFIPVGSVEGGNLLCMNKTDGRLYIWIHDQIDHKFYLAGECIHDFLMRFQMHQNQISKNDFGVVGVKCSDDFLKALQGI